MEVRNRLWRVRVRWCDDDGVIHRATAEATSKALCEKKVLERIAEARAELLAGRSRKSTSDPEDLTLDEVAARWFAALGRSGRRPSTVAQYQATWRGALSPVLGAAPVNALSRAQAQTILTEGLFARARGEMGPDGVWIPGANLRDEDGRRRPLSGEQPRAVLRQVLRFAADRGYRVDGVNVLDGTESPQRRQPDVRALTDHESERLIATAKHWARTGHGASDVLWHGLVVLRYTGIRIGELLALTWGDIELHAQPPTVTIRQTLLEPRSGVDGLGPTKQGTIDVIALHPDAVEVLRSRMPQRANPSSFVFATRTGRPVTAANFRRALRDRVRGTDLSWVHPHSFRATVGTKAEALHDLEAARDLLRHRDDRVTRRHYVERNNMRILDPRSLFEPRAGQVHDSA